MPTIDKIDVHVLRTEGDARPHWVSLFPVPQANELLVRLTTSDGVEGFGLATSYTDISPITRVFDAHFAEQILGEDPTAPERL